MVTPKGCSSGVQGAGDAAVADDAHRLIVKQVGVDVAIPQVPLFAGAHQPVAIGDLAAGGDRHTQRELGHLPGEPGRRAQDADAPAIARFIIQALRKAARDIHDGAQLRGAVEHVAVMPTGADYGLGFR